MLMSLATKVGDSKTSTGYYYTQQQQQYPCYCPISLNNDSNHFQNYHDSIYDSNHYYTLSAGYSHNQTNNHVNEEDSNKLLISTVSMPTYHHPYCIPEEHANEILYSPKLSNLQTTAAYDYNVSAIPSHPANLLLHQHATYAQTSIEQVDCRTHNTADFLPSCPTSDGTCRSGCIVVELINRPLWLKFAAHTLENIITKTGRRMFPSLEFKVYGLKPETTYDMYVDMVLVDSNHWKFNSGKWTPFGQSEQSQETNHFYLHPDSPNSGAYWMNNEKISFSKLKLTNNKQLSTSHPQNQMIIMLHSMHKYMPRLNIVEISNQSIDLSSSSHENSSSLKHKFTFPETQFIAVTAYQNTDVTQLKIDNNPFAKGFRDNSDYRNIYNYGSPSSTYSNRNNIEFDYYRSTYKPQQPCRKTDHN